MVVNNYELMHFQKMCSDKEFDFDCWLKIKPVQLSVNARLNLSLVWYKVVWSLDSDRGLFAFVFFFHRRLVVGGRRRVRKFVVNQTVQGDDRTNQRRQVNWKKLTVRGHQRALFFETMNHYF